MIAEKPWQPVQVLMLGALVMLSMVGGVLAATIARHIAQPYLDANSAALLTLFITVLGFHGGSLIWVHFFVKLHDLTWGEAFGFARRNSFQSIAAAVIALPVVVGGVVVLGIFSGWGLEQLNQHLHWTSLKPEPQDLVQLLRKQWAVHLIVLQGLVTVVLAPFAEEVLFRGILYTAIKQRGHRFVALWLPATLFAAIHFYPVGFLSLLFLAVVLVGLYEWTQNLLAPILLHALFNALNFALIVAHPKWAERLFPT